MKILYFDCFSGISGDMVIGALIDAGADPVSLEEELKKLGMESEYELKWHKVVKNGITSTKFDVVLKDGDNRSHHHVDRERRPENGENEHNHHHYNDHVHDHDHDHEHHHHHDHEHRSYRDIVKLIEAAGFSPETEDKALRIFKKIGEAEGKIHGLPLEEVHFHEVGAVDSIIDIVGTAILLDQLEIDAIKSSPIPTGGGNIHIEHGVYPVPAPATLEVLRGIPITGSEVKAELTTPTGAAIAAVLAESFCSLPEMRISEIGYGAGTKTFSDHPNVLRIMIGE